MLDLATVTFARFESCLGQAFELPAAGVVLVLTDARALGPDGPVGHRRPFALTFEGAPAVRLPQQIHRLENATLGIMEIFLVQTGADAKSSQFEAIFA